MVATPRHHWTLAVDGNGCASDQTTAVKIAEQPKNKWLWTHATLGSEFNVSPYIDEHISELLMIEPTRPRFASYPMGALLILRGVGPQNTSLNDDLISVRLWIAQDRVISLVRKPVGAISEIAEQYELDRGPASPAEFIAELAQRLVENMADIMASIEDDIAKLETDSISGPKQDLQERMASRRMSIIPLRRYLAPQREALTQLLATRLEWLNDDARHRLRDALDITTRYIEDLDEARDQLDVIQASLAVQFAERTNRAMLLLGSSAAECRKPL